jgi:hypothetical protein
MEEMDERVQEYLDGLYLCSPLPWQPSPNPGYEGDFQVIEDEDGPWRY